MADKCGFGCKLKKFAKKQVDDHRTKKAKSFGYDTYNEWSSAVKNAETAGRKKAGKKRLKQIEKAQHTPSSGGGFWGSFDKFVGAPPARKHTVKRKSTAPAYVVVGGKAYQKGTTTKKRAAPRRKAAPRKQKDPFDYGDFF